MANPYVNKVIVNGVSRLDLTSDTVSADKLLSGYTAHNAAGASITGSYTPATAQLNIVAYASAFPASADENTIGIISSTAVNGYIAQGEQPTTGLAEGLVWIRLGNYSPTPIMFGSANPIYICPVSASQYQLADGALTWVTVEAKCYQNLAWRAWDKDLYNNGVCNVPWCVSSSSYFTFGASSITCKITNGKRGAICTASALNITDYSNLCIERSRITTQTNNKWYLGLNADGADVTTTYPDILYEMTDKTAVTREIFRLSIANVASENAAIKLYGNAGGNSDALDYTIYRIWLEA